MKLHWRVLRNLFGAIGLVVSFGSPIASLFKTPVIGLSWEWYVLMGITVLLITLGVTIAELHNNNQKLTSHDAEQGRKKRQLEIEKLEEEKKTWEHPVISLDN